jgi:hypothetical protein
MRSVLASTLLLAPLIAALPSPNVDRILPLNWKYTITSLDGPGCPDLGADPEAQRTTRLTYGQNTMDGSEIYYWFIAYPSLRVDLAGSKTSWCETELKYQEYKDLDQKVKAEQYRLRLHKNGTRAIATYELDAGVKATAKFTYDAGNDLVPSLSPSIISHQLIHLQITDTISWTGPASSGQYAQESVSPVSARPELYKLPKCGSGTIKFRTELSVQGGKGKKGVVASEHTKDADGKEQWYGVQQGFSYDWEKCGE